MKEFLTVFGAVFLAELADKTQLAIFSFTANAKNKWMVLLGAVLALSLTSLIAVLFGEFLSKVIPAKTLKIISGVIFIAIGIIALVLKD
ncbi:MAG: TMEM165/GDT1 family protein [Caldisericaceae bacterium]